MTKAKDIAIAKHKELMDDLHQKVVSLTTGDEWMNYLKFAARFRKYSFNNQMLIWMQAPEAEFVAGYKKWQEMGRQVQEGSKAIRIFGFREYNREVERDGEMVEERRVFHPLAKVFNYADTKPREGAQRVFEPQTFAERLTGTDEAGIFERLAEWLRVEAGYTVSRETLTGTMNGYTTVDGSKRVVVSDEVEDAQAAKTLIHEAAHVLLHVADGGEDYRAHRGICEVEAESVAFVVAGSLGLDTSGYSVGYVAQWAEADHDLIESTGKRVLKTAQRLTEVLTEDGKG